MLTSFDRSRQPCDDQRLNAGDGVPQLAASWVLVSVNYSVALGHRKHWWQASFEFKLKQVPAKEAPKRCGYLTVTITVTRFLGNVQAELKYL